MNSGEAKIMGLIFSRIFCILFLLSLALCSWADSSIDSVGLPEVNSVSRERLINGLEEALNANYVYPELAQKMSNSIHLHEKNGDYNRIVDPNEFAAALTKDLLLISKDLHVKVRYSEQPVPMDNNGSNSRTRPDPNVELARLKYMQMANFGFEKYEHLVANVAYLDIRGFFPADAGGATANAVMSLIANADGLIIDLRNNFGGDPEMVTLVASYLFDGDSVHLDSIIKRQENQTIQFWTASFVAGARYGKEKPVYILTSKDTFSAGEAFAYDLQALKRTTVIGETTKGGANPGRWVHLDEHFACLIPTGRAVNPITGTNWEGVGVHPDIEVSSDLALKMAELLATKSLIKNISDSDERELAVKKISELEADLVNVKKQ